MILGTCVQLHGDDALEGLRPLREHLLPARRDTLRAPKRKELADDPVLALSLAEWSVKVADGHRQMIPTIWMLQSGRESCPSPSSPVRRSTPPTCAAIMPRDRWSPPLWHACEVSDGSRRAPPGRSSQAPQHNRQS